MNPDAQTALLGDLERGFHQLEKHYAKLKTRIDGQIVRWRYAKRRAFTLRYGYLQRANIEPGKLIDMEPTPKMPYYAYGYDTQGRIVSESHFRMDELPVQCAFFEYHAGYTDLAGFKKDAMGEHYRIIRVGRLVHPDPVKPAYYAEYGEMPNGTMLHTFERYEFDERRHLLHVTERDRQGETTRREAYEYLRGRLAHVVDNTERSHPLAQYESARAEERYNSLREAARASLRQAIIDIVQGVQSTEDDPIFCMVISTEPDTIEMLLLAQSEREAWGDERLYTAHEFFDNPVEWFEINPLPEAVAQFLRQVESDGRWEDYFTLMTQAARELNDHDWSAIFEPTDDFIVFALESLDPARFEESLIASIPKEKCELLRKRGYLE